MANPSAIKNRSRAVTPAREISWSFMLLVILCACVVAAGFFFAARQHFTAMEYSIKNSKLREQLQSLDTEKRRLELAREVALSPSSIRKAARGLGLREGAETTAVLASAKSEQPRIEVAKVGPAAKEPVARTNAASPVVKTVLTQPAQQPTTGGETRSRVVDSRKDKKEAPAVAAVLKFR